MSFFDFLRRQDEEASQFTDEEYRQYMQGIEAGYPLGEEVDVPDTPSSAFQMGLELGQRLSFDRRKK